MEHPLLSQKVPVPSAVDLEEAVLGAIMLDNEALKSVTEILGEKMFYKPEHQFIYNAVLSLQKSKTAVDILTVTQELVKKGNLEKAGKAYYVTQLTNRIGSSANVEAHARIVQEMYLKRQAIALGYSLLQKGYDDGENCFEVLDYAKSTLRALEAGIGTDILVDNKQTIDEVLVDITEAGSNGGIIGASSGIKSLDMGIMGFRGGLKYEIGGLPGAGKSSLAKNITLHFAHKLDMAGVFFSTEMTRKQLMMGCISELLKIPNELIQRGNISEDQKKSIDHLKRTLFSKNFLIDDRGGLTMRQMRTRIRKLVDSHNIKWFAFDYIQLAGKGQEARGKSEEAVLAEIAAETKNLAKEYNLICIELSQLNREQAKGKTDLRPKLHHFKGSGAIEANADVAILIYRPEMYGIKTINGGESSHGYAELILAKNRFGQTKILMAKYEGKFTKFSEDERGTEVIVMEEDDTGF